MWQGSNEEILSVEKLLLDDGYHFSDDAKEVIRFWNSTDVVACPGSGKTTVLLAKLKLLADRMPFEDGAGVCVLSHTNVAVNQIKEKLSDYLKKLTGYPNYLGTIQSFIDQFVTIPYIRGMSKNNNIRFVSSEEYSGLLYEIVTNGRNQYQYKKLTSCLRSKFGIGFTPNNDLRIILSNLKIRDEGLYHKEILLAKISSDSAKQYIKAKEELLIDEGVLLYEDTYQYVKKAVNNLSSDYTDLFSMRFRFVFVDEYQDCSPDQISALEKLFHPEKCVVMHFGDPDQAIYGSIKSEANRWVPGKGYLSISNSNRYGQEIANKLSFLRTNRQEIIASRGFIGHKPILIIYNDESIHSVITEYLAQLYKNGLCDPNGIYTVIGHIKNPGTAGKTIGSYWSNFVGTKNRKNIEKYWDYVDKICESLKDGKIYNTEPVIRELFLKIFQYAKVNLKDRKIITMRSFRKYLNENYYDIYRNGIMRLVLLQDINRCSVNETIQLLLSDIFGDLERIRIMNAYCVSERPVLRSKTAAERCQRPPYKPQNRRLQLY